MLSPEERSMITPLLHHQEPQPQRSSLLSSCLRCCCFVDNKQRPTEATSSVLSNGGLDVTKESYFHSLQAHHQNAIKLSLYMRYVFENHANELPFSEDFIRAMLCDDSSGEIDTGVDGVDALEKNGDVEAIDVNRSYKSFDYDEDYHQEEHHIEYLNKNDDVFMKGLPRRPFYKTLSIRIILWTQLYQRNCSTVEERENEEQHSGNETNTCNNVIVGKALPRTVIDATELGFTEKTPPTLEVFHFDQDGDDQAIISEIVNYINKLQIPGIFEYLGLRSTVGTVIDVNNNGDNSSSGAYYLDSIPSPSMLLQAANQPHNPTSNPPRITLAGRARAKHAHRGKSQYFGVCNGSTQQKNEAANKIVSDMINNAAWINLHEFGGVNTPVFELRIMKGYGARWSICKNGKNTNLHDLEGKNQAGMNVAFRGFLEPQMDDGFEKNWRH